jgi:hypothetical protein
VHSKRAAQQIMAHRLERQRELPQANDLSQKVLRFPPSSSPKHLGTNALNLVYQAAEVFSGIEERARETESHARSLCKSAAERLQLAERRTQAAESTLNDVMKSTDRRLHDASKAIEQAQAEIKAAEDRAAAFEFRAQAAEAQLCNAKQALFLVEECIRQRLLSANCTYIGSLDALAV